MKFAIFFFVALIPSFLFFVYIPKILAGLNEYYLLPVYFSQTSFICGIVLVFISSFFVAYSFFLFRFVGNGTPAPFVPAKKMILRGPYLSTRNPMYLSYLGIFFGEALVFGHALLFAYVGVMFLVMHLYIVFLEEPELRRRFGDEYEEYAKKIPRWILH